VTFNEASPHGLDGLRQGIEAIGPEAGTRARVVPGRAGDCTELIDGCDLAVVDPPRRGLDAELVAALAAAPPRQLIYLSCGVESFERDTRTLLAGGGLQLRRLVPYALFPFTEHVETLALFEERRSPDDSVESGIDA